MRTRTAWCLFECFVVVHLTWSFFPSFFISSASFVTLSEVVTPVILQHTIFCSRRQAVWQGKKPKNEKNEKKLFVV